MVDGPITFANTFCAERGSNQRVIPTYAGKLIRVCARLIGRSREPAYAPSGSEPRFTVLLVMHNGLQEFWCTVEVVHHTRQMRSPSVSTRTGPSVRRSIPNDAMVRESRFAPELLDYLFCRSVFTYKFQSFPRNFLRNTEHVIINRHGRCGKIKR